MGKSIRSRIIRFGIAFSAIILSFFSACEIGLGAAVDTEAPSIDIVTPPVDAIVRNEFALKGTWDDDGSIEGVTVTLKRTDGYGTPSKYEATVTDVKGKKDWFVVLNSEESPILDGAYEATVEIADTAGHKLSQTRTFSIDNTPPLIILQRPGTKLNETPDAYGQTFSLNGMGADDNSIDHIDVEIFSDAACTNLLKKITKSNVPPTIELDVAVFEDGVANDYSEIYGSTSKNGTQNRYCKITAYDNAKSYPANSDEVDETGNKTSVYYLYDDIYTGILENHSATEVYKMLSGTWIISGQGRSADQISSVKALLAQHQMSESNFSLNPENNPRFTVSGKSSLTKNGHDFDEGNNDISNGAEVVVEVSTGLDGISLNQGSLRPYIIPCNEYGNAAVDNVSDNRIYLAATGSGTKSGTSYKFVVSLNQNLSAANTNVSLNIGGKYIFGVEGTDVRGNSVVPNGGDFGFKFISNGAAPDLSIIQTSVDGTNWSTENMIYVKKGDDVYLKGTVTVESNLANLRIYKDKTNNPSPIVTDGESSSPHTVYTNPVESGTSTFQYMIPAGSFDQNTTRQYSIRIEAETEKTSNSTVTVRYDVEGPVIRNYSITPKCAPATSGGFSRLNGTVTVSGLLSDAYSGLNTTNATWKILTRAPSLSPWPAYTNNTNNPNYIAPTYTGTITNPEEFSFNIDTRTIEASETTTKDMRLVITAYDEAGNESHFIYDYNVDQSTDYPVVVAEGTSFDTALSYAELRTAVTGATNSSNIVTKGTTVTFKISDDDGFANSTATSSGFTIVRTKNQSTDDNSFVAGETNTQYCSISGNPTSPILTYDLPDVIASYRIDLYLKDKVGNLTTSEKPYTFYVQCTGNAPVVTMVTTPTYVTNNTTNVLNPVNDFTVNLTITEGSGPFTVKRVNLDNTETTLSNASSTTEITDTFTPTNATTDGTVGYTITDVFGKTKELTFNFKLDNERPTATLAEINGTYVGSSYTFSGTASDTKSQVASVQLSFDSAFPTTGTYTATGTSSWNYNAHLTELLPTEGQKTLYVRSVDTVGNLSETANRSFMYDLNLPNASIANYKDKDDGQHSLASTTAFNYGHKFSLSGVASDTNALAATNPVKLTQTKVGANADGTDQTVVITTDIQREGNTWTCINLPRKADGNTFAAASTTTGETRAETGTYKYKLTVTDAAGRISETEVYTVVVDNTAPTLILDYPSQSANVSGEDSLYGNSCIFKATSTDSAGGTGTEYIYYKFDSATDYTQTSAADSIQWKVTKTLGTGTSGSEFDLYEGQHTISLYSVDKAENLSNVITKTFWVDQASPVVTETQSTSYVKETATENGKVTLGGTISETHGIKTFKITRGTIEYIIVNNGTVQTAPVGVTWTYTPTATGASWSLSETPGDGSYTYTIVATDKADRVNTTLSRSITIDTTDPAVNTSSIVLPTSTQTEGSLFKFEGDVNDSGTSGNAFSSGFDKVELAFNTSDTTAPSAAQTSVTPDSNGHWSSTIEFAGNTAFSSQGPKYLWVRVFDKAGNVSDWTPSSEFIYDTTAPTISFTEKDDATNKNPDGNTYRNTGFTFEVHATDSYGIDSVKVARPVILTSQPSDWATNYYTNAACTERATNFSSTGTYFYGVDAATTATGTLITEADYTRSFVVGSTNEASANYLPDGTHNFTITVKDKSGKTVSVTRTITVDTIAPIVSWATASYTPVGENVGTGADLKTWYKSSSVRFAIDLTESNFKTAEICKTGSASNPESMSVSGGKYYATLSGLAEGANQVSVTVKDLAENETTISTTVYIDSKTPTFSIDESTVIPYMKTSGFTVSGTAADEGAASSPVTGSGIEYLKVKEEHKAPSASDFEETEASNNGGVNITINDSAWSQHLPLDGDPEEGEYKYTFIVKDNAGNEVPEKTFTTIVDTTLPTLDKTKITLPSSTQTESSLFKFEGEAGCVADTGSGLDKVELAFTSTNTAPSVSQTSTTPVSSGSTMGSWGATVEFANSAYGNVFNTQGEKYLWVRVLDKAGNASAWDYRTFVYDTAVPTFTLSDETPATNSYKNTGFTISGTATDTFGLDSVVITGQVQLTSAPDNWANAYTNYYTDSTCTTAATATFNDGIYYLKQDATTTSTVSPITSALYSKAFRVGTETTNGAILLADGSYNFTITAKDLAGKTYSVNRTITIEREAPSLTNIKLIVDVDSENNDIEAYRKSETEPYYINNTTSTSLKITGVATDNIGVQSVTISIPGYTYTGTNSGSTARWRFENINLSSMTVNSATATITVTDKAGNTNTDDVVINFDTTAPAGYHEADSLSKDLYFRIGDNDNDDIDSANALWDSSKDTDVGKKYSDRTYGNSDTIEIRGKITDSASGVKMIYYYVFDKPVALDQSYITPNQVVSADNIVVSGVSQNNVSCYGFKDKAALADWVISHKKGNFAPGTTVSKRVFYNVTGTNTLGGDRLGTTDKYWKIVDTNYRASLSGFENSSNFLVIAVEDNVGNKGVDFATVDDKDKIFCQINKDVTPPNILLNSNEESMRFHNASASGNNIVLQGTIEDDLAGIRNLKFRVNGKFIPNEEANQPSDRYGTIVTNYNDAKTSGTWTLTIKPAALAGASDNISVYGIATDDAGIGNSQTLSVATICVDVTPPTVSITLPKDKGSVAGTQINGIISLSGKASDRNGLKEETTSEGTTTQTMNLYYTTSSTLSTALTSALAAYTASPATATYPTLTTGEEGNVGTSGTQSGTRWIPIGTASHDTTWTFANIDTTKLDGNTTIDDTTTVYFTVAAIDKAGNTGYATPITVIVDQNTDRPTVSFSNLDLTDMSYNNSNYIWLKNTTKVIGTISDDDDDETGTNTLEISLTGSDSDWHTVTLNGSSFSYDLKTLYTATATQTEEQLANGPKTLYFRVTDKKNKQFTSATTNTTSALYLSDGTNTYGDAASGAQAGSIVYVKVDTQYPEVALLGARYIEAANTTETSNAAYSTTYSSFVIGETHRIFRVKFTASDTNGINDNSITGTATFPYGTGDSAGSIIVEGSNLTVPTEQVDYYTLTFTLTDTDAALLKADEGYDGSVNVRISVSDNAGNATPQTATMSYDFKPSVASFSNPDSSVSQSGEVEAYGSLSETATVSYKVTTSQTESATDEEWHTISDATGLNWTIHFDNNTNSANGTHAKSLNKYLIDYELAEHDTGSQAPDAIVSSYETFTTLYLWIKTVDHAGNEKKFNHPILVDPQGDKPNLQFSYPAANNGTLGGTISIYGTATDTKGSEANKIGVDSVWVQIKSTTHRAAEDTDTYGTSPSYASATNTVSMALTEADLDYMVNNGYQVYKRRNYVVGAADSVNNAFKWTTSSNLATGEPADDYAALANLNGAAWDIEINKKSISGRSEFDPPEGTNSNPIAIRVYARDKDGKFSSKVDRYVSFDADTPVISDLKVVQSADGNVNSTATATKTYSPDMFLKGPWYLTGTITDKEGIKELKVNGQTLITYTEPESEPNPVVRIVGGETEDTEDWSNAVSISENDGGKTIKFKYPLFTRTQSGDISYSVPTTFTVSVKDKIKGNNAHPGSSSITINYDNTNPQVAEDEAHGLNIDTSIHQSNRWYKFGSKAMEPDDDNGTKQSGFAYTAFYFTRTSTNTLYDVLKDRNSAAISISGTIPVLGSANDTDNAIVTNNNLYWYHRTISNISGQTFTISNATAIRPSSLLQINGAFYLVTAVSGTSITVDSPVPAGSTVAYVAIAGIINNTTPEGDGTAIQTDGYYEAPSRDDGDRMIESVDKSGTTWAWEAKICSRNIPDGPIILHYVVFDKAGNSTTRTVSGMISNNQPRIAGVIVKTDFNGDGDVDDTGETINNYSTSLSYTSYYTGTKTTGTAPDTVTKNVFDPDENVKNTNAKNPLPTSTTYGSASEPITVLRGKTEIYPEIVGGNGALYYGYKVGDTTTYTNNTTSPFITNGSTDYTVQTGIINIQHGDLIDFGDTTNAATAKAFAFKFWDSTEGGTRFSSTNPTQTAELTMYFAVQAQKVGNPWVKINPFYWNSLTDNSIYGSSTASAYKDLQGHIELEADWKTTTVYAADATSGLYDDDPKVSGKIVLSGTAHDDKLIKEMKASIFGATAVQVASYSNGALSSTKTSADFNTNHYWFEVLSQTINSTGHDVSWKLYIDTATALSTVAGTDKSVTVTATNYGIPTATTVEATAAGALPGINGATYYAANLDYATGNTNTPGTSQTAKTKDAENNPILTAYYKMDVVPYITGIRTPNRSKSGLKDSNIRSASGKYSVIKGSTNNFITVTGFNLNVSGARIVKTERLSNLTAFTADDVSLEPTNKAEDFTSFQGRNNLTKSGYLEVLVNGVRALNNINNNNSHGSLALAGATATVNEWNNFYNREPDYYSTKNVQLTDDRYILVWDMHDTGDRTKNGAYPTMFMEGDDPVFGYFNPSGGPEGAYGDGAGTGAGYNINLANNPYNTFPEYAMPQRIKFNSDGTEAYTEYLAKNSAGDQMGTGRDDSGRYYHMSVFNRGGCALYMIYDRYNEFYAKMGWAPGVQIGTPDDLVVSSGNNGIGLETINYGGLLAGRYQYPKIIAKGNSINGRAYVYVAYYDDYYHSIVMRNFRVGSTVTGNGTYALDSENKDLNGTTYAQRINFAENPTNRDNNSYGTGRLSGVGNVTGTPNANNSASKYFDMKVTSDYHIILVYYDETSSSLKLRYSTNPVTGNSPTTAIAWTENTVTFPEYVGNYVSLDLDSDDGLHMSAFDATDGNLVYMYLPSYSSTSLTKVTVDQASSVGNWTQIKLNSNDVPYIAYYNSTETGSRDSIKLAYAKNAAGSVTAGVDVAPGTISGTGYTLSGWEYMTVPSVNPAQGGNPNFQNVCLGFDTAGVPVVGYCATNIEFGKWLDE